jgi:hypothetical protein
MSAQTATMPDGSRSRIDIRSFATVGEWLTRSGHDSQPAELQTHYLEVLANFVDHDGKDPDELVAYCFLRKRDSGLRFVSNKRRVAMNESIDAFVAAQGWVGREAVVNANVIRSFLIHNGVFIQGKVWTR